MVFALGGGGLLLLKLRQPPSRSGNNRASKRIPVPYRIPRSAPRLFNRHCAPAPGARHSAAPRQSASFSPPECRLRAVPEDRKRRLNQVLTQSPIASGQSRARPPGVPSCPATGAGCFVLLLPRSSNGRLVQGVDRCAAIAAHASHGLIDHIQALHNLRGHVEQTVRQDVCDAQHSHPLPHSAARTRGRARRRPRRPEACSGSPPGSPSPRHVHTPPNAGALGVAEEPKLSVQVHGQFRVQSTLGPVAVRSGFVRATT